jgi:hypothetical protein
LSCLDCWWYQPPSTSSAIHLLRLIAIRMRPLSEIGHDDGWNDGPRNFQLVVAVDLRRLGIARLASVLDQSPSNQEKDEEENQAEKEKGGPPSS